MLGLVAGLGQYHAIAMGEQCLEIVEVGADGGEFRFGELGIEGGVADLVGQHALAVFIHEAGAFAPGIGALLHVAFAGSPRGVIRAPCLVQVIESGQFGVGR